MEKMIKCEGKKEKEKEREREQRGKEKRIHNNFYNFPQQNIAK